ncbi:type IV secretory system conjugative DNA transfer family protein [Merismopedia glauca]|uniref:Type IV secretion system protein VirD4 n=1 Tax=Merismopedia glauca CCAP 1448/3 TaxID=1296344 RepID=A0A2T1C281_9CYAN|nr:TraM recognition domain-containing protein [Merismopedia glauca]PSB02380.1 type IV secretion system protein VirD4 [Merismopedia glauca CCAP 1448/3]
MKHLSTTTQQPSFPFHLFSDPNLQLLGISGILLVIALIAQAMSGSSRKGKTARAGFASARQIANSARVARKMLQNPGPKNFTYYVTEPIGKPVPPPHKLGRYKVGNNISYFTRTNTSALIIGGAGSGKTANFINPAVISAIRQGSSIIYYDYKFPDKDQSLPIIMEALKEGYQVRILAPGQELSQCFNCVDLIPDDTAITKASEVINVMALNYFDSPQKKDYFDRSGSNIAAGALLLAKWIAQVTDRPELANLLMASQILSLNKLPLRLIQNKDKLNPWTYKAFDGLTSIQTGNEVNKQQVGVIGTAQEIFKNPTAIELIPALCGASTLPLFDKDDPLKIDGKVLLVLGVDKGLKESILPAFATILHQLLTYNLDAKRPRKTTLVTVVDEVSTIKVPWFLTGINQERGAGFSGIFGAQYPGQLKDAYGAALAEGFEASCGTTVWFATGNQETAEHVSKKLGEKEIILDSKSKSTSSGKNGGCSRSTNEQRHKVALLEAQEIQQFPPGKAVIFTPGVGDSQVSRVPYIHQFRYDENAASAHSREAQQVFEKLQQALIAANPPQNPKYYSDLLDEYHQILEKWLPLAEKEKPGQQQQPTPNDPKPLALCVKGVNLIDTLKRVGMKTDDIDPHRDYPVPEKLLDSEGRVLLSIPNCLEILGGNKC